MEKRATNYVDSATAWLQLNDLSIKQAEADLIYQAQLAAHGKQVVKLIRQRLTIDRRQKKQVQKELTAFIAENKKK